MVYEGGDDNDCNVGTQVPLEGNGDFANDECVQLLDEADIVVSNPPFSIAREKYIPLLIKHQKDFLIVGDMNWITYKTVFPLLKEGKMWLGKNHISEFQRPDGSYKKFGNKLWFTNLSLSKRSEKLLLTSTYDPKKYPKYDNYDAIHINKCNEIPKDYAGVMGVPISFLEHHCKEQFEIIGFSSNEYADELGIRPMGSKWIQDYKKSGGTGHLTANMKSLCLYEPDGTPKSIYARIIVKRLDLPYNPSNWTNSSYKIPHPTEDDINPEIEAYIRQTIREILSSNQYQDTGDPNDLFAFMQTYIKTSPASEFDIDELKLYIASERAKFFA